MIMSTDNIFLTSDFVLAVSLHYMGITLDTLDRSNPSRVSFAFRRDKKLDDIIKAFWRKELSVEPLAFCHVQKELKARMYSHE